MKTINFCNKPGGSGGGRMSGVLTIFFQDISNETKCHKNQPSLEQF